jgi:hypothetical protein
MKTQINANDLNHDLDDLRISRIRFNDGWLFLKAFFLRIRITRIIGFTGCYLMMVRYAQVMEGTNRKERKVHKGKRFQRDLKISSCSSCSSFNPGHLHHICDFLKSKSYTESINTKLKSYPVHPLILDILIQTKIYFPPRHKGAKAQRRYPVHP